MVINWLSKRMFKLAASREPDFLVHPEKDYMRRWWVIPKNSFFNIYLHRINASDEDRALHDHPWWSCSILLEGSYIEHTPEGSVLRKAGDINWRGGNALHRLEVAEGPIWTIFITGPKYKEWGFATKEGWMHNEEFEKVYQKAAHGL